MLYCHRQHRGNPMKTFFKFNRNFASFLLAAATLLPMAHVMAQPSAGLPVPPEVPDGSTFILFGPHWGKRATVSGGRVPTPPPGAYGNFLFPDGNTWYGVSHTPPSGWPSTIVAGRCKGPCPAGVNSGTFALIAPLEASP